MTCSALGLLQRCLLSLCSRQPRAWTICLEGTSSVAVMRLLAAPLPLSPLVPSTPSMDSSVVSADPHPSSQALAWSALACQALLWMCSSRRQATAMVRNSRLFGCSCLRQAKSCCRSRQDGSATCKRSKARCAKRTFQPWPVVSSATKSSSTSIASWQIKAAMASVRSYSNRACSKSVEWSKRRVVTSVPKFVPSLSQL